MIKKENLIKYERSFANHLLSILYKLEKIDVILNENKK